MDEVQTVYDFKYDTPSSETYNTQSNSCPSVHKNLCLVCNLVNYHRLQTPPLTRWIQSIYPHLISSSLTLNIICPQQTTNLYNPHFFVIQSKISTMQAYQFQKHYEAMREINGSESYELRSANKLFIAKQLKLRECIAHLFQDEVQPLDFDVDPEAARQSINNWVEIQTKRHIKDLIPEDKITRDTDLVLVRWKQNFSCVHRTGVIGQWGTFLCWRIYKFETQLLQWLSSIKLQWIQYLLCRDTVILYNEIDLHAMSIKFHQNSSNVPTFIGLKLMAFHLTEKLLGKNYICDPSKVHLHCVSGKCSIL